ncbi:polymorphic toxin type 37 domain-containing protein [Mycobacteroides abscessus]|uniref:polymorphic toxin type 37 domain-containing protein n=1 Tax=Mycobacteroides abscessus TaxID=36809 RepID=UPI00031A7AE3|nr:polymorphic toxin type 37 domain-containing protein [Mycobacteroides abscessus]
MPVVVESAAYYAAANTCYKLSTDVQAAFKPLSRVLTLETSGMAGGYQAVKAWSSGYDNRAAALTTASTEYARALQRLGDILTAAGYNWAIADWRANRDPDKGTGPACPRTIPSELPYGADVVVGVASSKHNGPGLESDVPDLYQKVVAQVAGGEIPDGDTNKLDSAAKAWKTFADNDAISRGESDLRLAASALSNFHAPDIPNLSEHLTTLSTSAGRIKLAASDLATSTTAHYAALNQLRSDMQFAIATTLGVGLAAIAAIAVITRGRATAGGAEIAATAVDACASSLAACIRPFLTTLSGITFSAEAVTAAGLGAIIGLSIATITGETVVYSNYKPPGDAFDKTGAKSPGYPGDYPAGSLPREFVPPKDGPKWVPNPNPKGDRFGWLDADGNVWVPTGQGGLAHGGPHWDVQDPKTGKHENVPPPLPEGEGK